MQKAEDIREKSTAGRAKDNKKDFKYIKNKINSNSSIGLSLDGDGKIINNDAEKAEVFNKYFSSIFGKKLDGMFVSPEDDEILSTPLVTMEDVKQHLLGINFFKIAGLDNLHPRVLKH